MEQNDPNAQASESQSEGDLTAWVPSIQAGNAWRVEGGVDILANIIALTIALAKWNA